MIIKHIIMTHTELFEDEYRNPFWKMVGMDNFANAKWGLYKVKLKKEGDV